MNCTEFESAIESCVEERKSLAANATEHLATCAHCQMIFEQHQQLDAAILVWRFPVPSAGLADAVLRDLAVPAGKLDPAFNENLDDWRDDGVERGSRTRLVSNLSIARAQTQFRRVSVVAVVACLCVGVISAIVFSGIHARRPLDTLANQQNQSKVSAEIVDGSVDVSSAITQVLFDLKSEYGQVANQTTSAAREIVRAIPPRPAVGAILSPDDWDRNREFVPKSESLAQDLAAD